MSLIGFPNPVDEVSARTVAAGVVVLSAAYVATGWWPLLALLAYGFWARVLTGPKLSPWGRLVTQVIRPRLPFEARLTAGPPKRFAQAIGATLSSVAVVVLLLSGSASAPRVIVAAITFAATLEAALGFCLGCKIFGLLMRAGLVPEEICAECADISGRLAARSAAS